MNNEQVGACSKCSLNCFMNQQNQITECCPSFFKVVFGKQFCELLIVPPRFSRKLAHLVSQRTYLENSNGRKWDVILSTVNGSVAFTKGWREFCKDHGIQIGDIVVFRLIKDSHFFAQIYGRSGCEKRYFSRMDTVHYTMTEPNRNNLTELTSALVPQPVPIHMQNHVSDHEIDTGNVACHENLNERLTLANTETSLGGKHDEEYVVYLSNSKDRAKENDADKTSENQLQVAVKTEPRSANDTEWLIDEWNTASSRKEALLTVALVVQPENVLQRQDDLSDVELPHLESNLPRNTNSTTTWVNVEDPCYMINRDGNTFREHEREVLFDLSTFENPTDKTVSDVSKKPRFQ